MRDLISCCSWACFIICGIPCSRLISYASMSQAGFWCSNQCTGAARKLKTRQKTVDFGKRKFSTGPGFQDCISSNIATLATRQIGGCQTAPARKPCCVLRGLKSLATPKMKFTSAVARDCRPAAAQPIHRREQKDDRSGNDLERAEQQIPLGSRARSRMVPICRYGHLSRRCDRRRGREDTTGAWRHFSDRSYVHSQYEGPRRAGPARRRCRPWLPARLEPVED